MTLSLSLLKNTINTARVDRKSITGVVRKKGGKGVQQPGRGENKLGEEGVCLQGGGGIGQSRRMGNRRGRSEGEATL